MRCHHSQPKTGKIIMGKLNEKEKTTTTTNGVKAHDKEAHWSKTK